MSRFDLHTHTVYCDGKNTPREMIEGAIEKGFRAIGFTAHAYTSFDTSYCIAQEDTARYLAELAALKVEYADRIAVFVGFEVDACGEMPEGDYDYLIGSAHYVRVGEQYYDVDLSREATERAIAEGFGGDPDAYAEAYFETLATVARFFPAIIGHFDLLTKFNEPTALVDTASPRYIAAWKRCADRLLSLGVPFEVNSGAMARGYRTSPYPARDILLYLRDRGAKFLLSGDAHGVAGLGYAFDAVEAELKGLGITPERAFLGVDDE